MKIAWIGEVSEFNNFTKREIYNTDIDFILVNTVEKAQGLCFIGYVVHWSYTKLLINQRRDIISVVKSRMYKDWIPINSPIKMPNNHDMVELLFENKEIRMWNDKWPTKIVTHWRAV